MIQPNPGEQHLDPRLVALIQKSERDGGIFLKDVPNPEDAIVEVHTQNSIYTIAIIDLEKGEVAMQGGKYLPEPELCYFRGSTFGGSMIKVGWVGVGMHLEVNSSRAGLLTTSSIRTVKVKEDGELAGSMRKKVKVTAPRVMTEAEARAAIQQFVEESFPPNVRPKALDMIGRFSLNGQIAIATLLRYALEQEKFERALALLERFYREHWFYQHPEVRGDPEFTTVNAQYLERAYAELGIALPKG